MFTVADIGDDGTVTWNAGTDWYIINGMIRYLGDETRGYYERQVVQHALAAHCLSSPDTYMSVFCMCTRWTLEKSREEYYEKWVVL